MNAVRIIAIALALGAALGAAFLVRGLVSAEPELVIQKERLFVQAPSVEVLTAARRLGAGEIIDATSFKWTRMQSDLLPRGATTRSGSERSGVFTDEYGNVIDSEGREVAMSDPSDEDAATNEEGFVLASEHAFLGYVVRIGLVSDEVVLEAKLVNLGAGLMSSILPKGMYAVTMGISAENASGGFIIPNDRIDIAVTLNREGGQFTETILANVKVLAVNTDLTDSTVNRDKRHIAGANLTLALSHEQGRLLKNAATLGQLSYFLRSAADALGQDSLPITMVDATRFITPGGGEEPFSPGAALISRGEVTYVKTLE